MKKFIIKVLLFLLFTLPVYFLLVAVWGDCLPTFLTRNLSYRIGSNGHMFTRLKEVEKIKNIDILFLGSSHAYRGFDTRIFNQYGYASFNLGSSAQTPLQTEILVNKYIGSLKPKVVIYEVYPSTFEIDGVESTLDLISNGKIDWPLFKLATSFENAKIANTILYRFYSDFLGRQSAYSENIVKGEDIYVTNGYVEKSPIRYYKAEGVSVLKRNYNAKNFEAFARTISTLNEHNILTILVQAPVTKDLNESFSDHEWFDNSMSKYGIYYNFNKIVTMSDSFYYDKDHLNQKGVERFNKVLLAILAEKTHLNSKL